MRGAVVKVGVVVLLALLTVVAARATYVQRYAQIEGTVVRSAGAGLVEVSYTVDGETMRSSVRGQRLLDDGTLLLPEPGDVVVVEVLRADPGEATLREDLPGFDVFVAGTGFLVSVVTAIVLLAPEYVRVRDPGDAAESHGFYWRS